MEVGKRTPGATPDTHTPEDAVTADTTEDTTTTAQDEGLTQTVAEATATQQDTTDAAASTVKDDDEGKGGKAAVLADLAKERDARQETQSKLDAVLAALGLKDDAKDDPEAAVKAATAKATEAETNLAVYKAAHAAGADPTALLDSKSFLATLDGIDPADTDAVTAAIKAAVDTNPRYAAGKPAPVATRDAVTRGDNTTGASPDDWLRKAAHRS